jgi:L-amino acid N-acyltransferase YncA
VPTVRPPGTPDANAIARIYNEGIEERTSTFETRPRDTGEILEWLELQDRLPVLVAEQHDDVLGWARILLYSDRSTCGWREVGMHLRHGRLEGVWRDVLVVERLLDPQAPAPDGGAASLGA